MDDVAAGGSGSLVIYSQSSASTVWSKKQKRVFQRITSWCYEAKSRGCQLSRVDLTTASGGPTPILRKHLQELRRRVERDLEYRGIEMFVVETREGNGVLHMIWAWQGDREFIVDQKWLSEQWEKIHGAFIVFIRRMNLEKDSIRRVGRYFALQYLADQRGALVRMSWSWKRSKFALGKAWAFMLKAYRARSTFATWTGTNPGGVEVSFQDLLHAWEELLTDGCCVLGETLFIVRDREVVELF